MTERSLLVRCANLGPYCVIGTDFPSARVFDSRRSALVAVVEEPHRSRLVNTSSAFATTLTSVALGTQAQATAAATAASRKASKKKAAVAAVSDAADEALDVYYAAMGLSNGTVVLHNITHDEPIDHLAVCETQHALIAMVFSGAYLFCLSASCCLYVVDVERRQCVLRGRCQADASSLAVSSVAPPDAQPGQPQLFRVLVSGPTMALYEVSMQASAQGEDGQQVQRGLFRRLLSFASQGSRVDLSWLSARAVTDGQAAGGAVPAMTASAQDGTIRLWDVREDPGKVTAKPRGDSPTESAAHVASVLIARCRRTLLCGQRMANISVLEGRTHNYVAATTVTGSLLLWDLGDSLLPSMAEPTPLAPHYIFVSGALVTSVGGGAGPTRGPADSGAARLLYSAILQSSEATVAHSDDVSLEQLRLLCLHGRFALPRFSAVQVGTLLEAHHVICQSLTPQQVRARAAAAASQAALGFFQSAAASSGAQSTQVVALAVPQTAEATMEKLVQGGAPTTGSDAAFAAADSVWLQQRQRLAAKAASTPSESFRAVHTHHAASMKELPVRQMTLEQRLRRLANETATAAANAKYHNLGGTAAAEETRDDAVGGEDELAHAVSTGTDPTHAGSLGLATVPLYQALHAGDTAAVMELLSVAGRSPEGMKATILALQLPYVLQLLKVLSERLGIISNRATHGTQANAEGAAAATVGGGSAAISTRSPLLQWIDTIVRYRGMEMYATQQEAGEKGSEVESATTTRVSPPKDFIAPILHQYRSLCAQYDKLALLYGRMSIFHAVRPSERASFVNRAPHGSANSNLELLRDGRQRRAGGGGASAETTSKLHKLYGHGDVLMEDLIFPATFKEVRTYRGGSRVVRVRSRVARAKRQHAEIHSDRALLRRARQLAAEKDKTAGDGGLLGSGSDDGEEDDMMMKAMLEANDGEMDLDALEENMRLDSDSDDDDEEDVSDAEESEDADASRAHKRRRNESRKQASSEAMLADDTRRGDGDEDAAEDADAMELDSSEAEFSAGSDDDVHSDVLDFSEDEEGSSSSSSDDDNDDGEEDGDDDDGDAKNSSDSADDADDGMGEDMQALLEEQGLESAADRRKHKRVRLD